MGTATESEEKERRLKSEEGRRTDNISWLCGEKKIPK
jgi:hypothetical protein